MFFSDTVMGILAAVGAILAIGWAYILSRFVVVAWLLFVKNRHLIQSARRTTGSIKNVWFGEVGPFKNGTLSSEVMSGVTLESRVGRDGKRFVAWQPQGQLSRDTIRELLS